MYSYSENNDYDDILKRLLDKIPNTLDKQQGSIIYDALAPVAAELAQCYIALDVYSDQTYLATAVGENLDNRVADYGLLRNSATPAQRIGVFTNSQNEPATIELGSRWSTPIENGGYNYYVSHELQTGEYILVCETPGTVGNEYVGTLLPLDFIPNLGTATLTEVYISGEDTETDETLRLRAINKISESPFGGNVAEYQEYVEGLDGVGACLVIPIWNGGGTVKLVVLTNSYEIPTTAKILEIQNLIDPIGYSGLGYGVAPIGHKVTVAAPSKYNINITCSVEVDSNHTLIGIEDNIKKAIEDYIKEVQTQWATKKIITIYISRLIAAILTVDGVTNVENLKINNATNNITLDATTTNNPFPTLNEVIINES